VPNYGLGEELLLTIWGIFSMYEMRCVKEGVGLVEQGGLCGIAHLSSFVFPLAVVGTAAFHKETNGTATKLLKHVLVYARLRL
jgi:hypothetical protein